MRGSVQTGIERSPSERRAIRRARVSLALACGVHSALLFVIWKSHSAHPADAESAENAVWELDPNALEPLPPERESPELPSPERDNEAESRSARAMAPGAAYEGRKDRAEPSGELPAPSAAPSGSAAPTAGEGWTFSPTGRGPMDLGLGSARGPKSFTYDPNAKAAATEGQGPPRSITGGLAEALDEEDAKRGMSRGAPVKVAVDAAAHTSDAPGEGKAVFDVAVDATGECHINLLSSNGDFEQWNRLAAVIRNHLAGKRVRVPPGARGLRVVVEVEARQQFPDGTTAKDLGGKVGMSDQGPSASYRGKVCGIGLTLGGLGGGCSPENAGAKPTRVVYSRIASETRY